MQPIEPIKPTDNLRVVSQQLLLSPDALSHEVPMTEQALVTVSAARQLVSDCLQGRDDRLVVVVGPCSIHDTQAALEYAERLNALQSSFENELCLIMRVYFEKPRTTVGWKGLINDPDLDNSFNINQGIRKARQLLLEINQMGLACGTEFLETISPQYIQDLIAWGVIGARTAESQVHRELASGLPIPIGFKNGTSGDIQVSIDAVRVAQCSHHFLSVNSQGQTAIFETSGNPDTHVVLRGGTEGPNYDSETIFKTCENLAGRGLPSKLMVDCSHGNSQKNYLKQKDVVAELARQIRAGSEGIFGVMIEGNLKAGSQSIDQRPLIYGMSITDACLSWEETKPLLVELAEAVKARRRIAKY